MCGVSVRHAAVAIVQGHGHQAGYGSEAAPRAPGHHQQVWVVDMCFSMVKHSSICRNPEVNAFCKTDIMGCLPVNTYLFITKFDDQATTISILFRFKFPVPSKTQ